MGVNGEGKMDVFGWRRSCRANRGNFLVNNLVVGHSSGVVTGIPSVPFTLSPFMQSAQSGPSGSTSFV